MIIIAAAEGSTLGPPNSIFELAGWLPFAIAVLGVVIGIVSILFRSKPIVMSALICEIALAVWGIALGCWRLHTFTHDAYVAQGDGSLDPAAFYSDIGLACAASSVSLFGVAIGLLLVAVGFLMAFRGSKNVVEQVGAHQPATR